MPREGAAQPKGTMEVEGDHTTITFRRVYRHRIEDVWDAIATPEGLRAWLMATDVRIDARAGGRIEMTSGPSRFRSTGTILVWEPPRVLEYEWAVAPVPEMPNGERAVVRYELHEEVRTVAGSSAETAVAGASAETVTHLMVSYRGLSLATSRGWLPGLHAFLDRLEAQLGGTAQPGFFERFAELRGEYPEWSHDAGA